MLSSAQHVLQVPVIYLEISLDSQIFYSTHRHHPNLPSLPHDAVCSSWVTSLEPLETHLINYNNYYSRLRTSSSPPSLSTAESGKPPFWLGINTRITLFVLKQETV